jgi:leader peptidase (prepilin peptidase)/N-methyltransferase
MVVLLGLVGLLIGSFINVVVLRTNSGKSFVTGRSECPKCHKQLAWYELMPLLSYTLQRGTCGGCGKRISVQYPLVEFITGLLFAGLYVFWGTNSTIAVFGLVTWLLVTGLLIAGAVYDWRWMLLPDAFMLPAIGIAALYVLLLGTYFGQNVLLARGLGAIVFAGFFAALWGFSKGKWLGDGDIRLAVVMGLMLSTPQLITAVFFSFNIAAVASVVLLATKRKTRKDVIPLGPFLIIGTFIGLFAGKVLIDAYLGF